MLAHAARRKVSWEAPGRLTQLTDGLLLPWLCPAQLRYQQYRDQYQCRHVATSTSPPTARPPHRSSPSTQAAAALPLARRQLATAAAAAEEAGGPDDFVPFDRTAAPPLLPTGGLQPEWPKPRRPRLSTLQPFDPASPIIINESLAQRPRRFRDPQGFGSNLAELHLTLEACLQVGRLERAAALVRRLALIYAPDAVELRQAHNDYLRATVEHLLRHRARGGLGPVQKWFEVDMRNKGVEPDATTYALMVKASLCLLHGPKMDRTVRRYMDLATDALHDVELLNLPILSDAELYQVTKICPTEFDQTDAALFAPDREVDAVPVANAATLQNPRPAQDIRPVAQKGLGLQALKRSLSMFAESHLPPTADGAPAEAAARQIRLEQDAVASAVDRWREESESLRRMGLNTALTSVDLSGLIWGWYESLSAALTQELHLVDEAEAKESKTAAEQDRCLYGSVLRLVPADKLAAITILSTMAKLSDRTSDAGVKLSSLIMSVADAIEDESVAMAVQRRFDGQPWHGSTEKQRQRRLTQMMKSRKSFQYLTRLVDQRPAPGSVSSPALPAPRWTAAIRAKVGAVVVAALISTARMPVTREHPQTGHHVVQEQPVFFHATQIKQGRKVGVVSANPALMSKMKREPHHIGLAKHLPMVAEPRPWTHFNAGGYLQYHTPVMRTRGRDRSQRHYVEAAADRGDMAQVFAGLDVLSRTPWRINRAVFDVMREAWHTGDAVANLAPEEPAPHYPPEPAPTADPKERRRWSTAVKKEDNQVGGLHSQRCFQNFQLEVARAFLDETFYFPHNVDFRGRAYPIPPYFNHMGADHCRGLLTFAEAKELGVSGLVWLKIHLANLYGCDKASFQEREDFTMEHLADIYDSATHPLQGRRWWQQAEDPWQCLAACLELKAALDSPDPTRFRSSLTIHQDGTCNGLQHYAALGGDLWGAKQVNLEPGDRPSDVYTGVAELVKAQIAADAAQGDELAKRLDGRITRKVVKQTVMTNVYGVTFVGARAQVRRQLEELMPDLPNTPELHHGHFASYVVRKIFTALSSMFNGAHDIQYWFAECASRISQALTPEQMDQMEKAGSSRARRADPKFLVTKPARTADLATFKSAVVWTTPLKMPVVQPYRTQKSRRISTNLQRVSILEPRMSDPVSKRKQLQAFPPNFIHSLDATHMLLSALKCDEVGLTFAAVHDSFWTHAGDVNTLNQILRDAFIRMHSEDVVGRLAAEFTARYSGCMYLASVRADSRVGQQIRRLRKSRPHVARGRAGSSQTDELLQERRRLRLLQSSDAEEQAQGRAMETPASIFEAADTEALEPPEHVVELGQVPSCGSSRVQVEADAPRATSSPTKHTANIADITEQALESEGAERAERAVESADASTPHRKGKKKEVRKGAPTKSTSSGRSPQPIKIWLPLTFPDVPKKGDFDVKRLRDSLYFFS
ncbi:MAG: DNA-directed RNA polymerase [Thelocarpon superellum]|nr:MAG: DNA-directed RNA polymerase [Thelocarpon superellum]